MGQSWRACPTLCEVRSAFWQSVILAAAAPESTSGKLARLAQPLLYLIIPNVRAAGCILEKGLVGTSGTTLIDAC